MSDFPPPVPASSGLADSPWDFESPDAPGGIDGEHHSTHSAAPIDEARDGDLTLAWRLAVSFAWIAAFFAYAAVWQASVQIGIATWWVGPRAQPAPTVIRLLPFFVCLVVVLLALYNVRRFVHLAIGAALLTSLIALPDFSRSVGLAVLELAISAALVVVGLSALTGRYRLGAGRPDPSQAP